MAENYRRKFEKYYGIKIPKGYDIHHIDLNHENNDISNLLLLPRELHSQYHNALYDCRFGDIKLVTKIIGSIEPGYMCNPYIKGIVNRFVDVYTECQKWKDYKMYLDGRIDNIHNITL